MHSIPFVKIGTSLDGLDVLILHHAPLVDLPGATPFGSMVKLKKADYERSCRSLIIESLDAYPSRVDSGVSEYQALGLKGMKALHRSYRFVGVQLGGPGFGEEAVEFAPYHLRSGGNLEGCSPGDRVRLGRDATNEAFVKAFDLACSRCRGYKP
jgi:hypothetical protein